MITQRDSDGTSTSTEALWTHRESLDAARIQRDISGFRLPVEIAIPHDAPPATPSSGDAIGHRWRLTLRVPGTPMHAAFELPVFHTEASRHSTTAVADASSLASSFLDHAAANLSNNLAASGILLGSKGALTTDCGLVIFDFRLIVEGQRFTRQCTGYDDQALHDDLNFAHRAWLQACLENPQSTIFSPQFWALTSLFDAAETLLVGCFSERLIRPFPAWEPRIAYRNRRRYHHAVTG